MSAPTQLKAMQKQIMKLQKQIEKENRDSKKKNNKKKKPEDKKKRSTKKPATAKKDRWTQLVTYTDDYKFNIDENNYWHCDARFSKAGKFLSDKLIPIGGPSKTKHGELLRKMTKLQYDCFNNGFGNIHIYTDFLAEIVPDKATLEKVSKYVKIQPKLLKRMKAFRDRVQSYIDRHKKYGQSYHCTSSPFIDGGFDDDWNQPRQQSFEEELKTSYAQGESFYDIMRMVHVTLEVAIVWCAIEEKCVRLLAKKNN